MDAQDLSYASSEADLARRAKVDADRRFSAGIAAAYSRGMSARAIADAIGRPYSLSYVVYQLLSSGIGDRAQALFAELDEDDGAGMMPDVLATLISTHPGVLIETGALHYVRAGNGVRYKLDPRFAARRFPANPDA